MNTPLPAGRSPAAGRSPGEQDFDTATEEVARGRILRAERLGLKTGAASKKASGKYAGIVEYQQITGVKKVGKIAKVAVGERSGGGGETEKAGAGAIGQRLLGDQFFGQIVVKIGNEH